MRFAQVNENGSCGTKGVAELIKCVEAEKNQGRGGTAGVGQGLSVEDELRVIEDSEDANSGRAACSIQPSVETHWPQSQPQGQVVCWERFLPVRSLKVLLVESDNSTRHVLSALLRNCSYEVIAVSNGIEAWNILEDLNNQIDLVLTEVVMAGLSGIGLLSKIMNHKICQNVPVIMMSSNDSMGIVLKCLSTGAADFLVKPIRKNELKNLWQHVWRRCHSSSGSGSESGIRNEKSIGAKSAEESNNDTGSDDEDDNRSIGLQARDGSYNGSHTQSSSTKRAAEVDSLQPLSPWDQLTDPPDSTCAQVIYPRPEAFASSWVPVPTQEHRGQDNQLDDVPMGKDLEIGIPRNSDLQLQGPSKKVKLPNNAETNQSLQLDLNLKNDGRNFDKEMLEISNDKPKGEWIKQVVNIPGDVSNNEQHRGSTESGIPVLSGNSKRKDKVMENVKDLPSLELSLKQLGDVADISTNVPEQNILGHSELSAFTRYNAGSTCNQGQTCNVGSCSPLDNSSEAAKQSNSDCTPLNQNSNSSSNNNDMGSTTDRYFTKPAATTDRAPAKLMLNCSHNSSVFQPVQNSHVSNPQLMGSGNACAGQVNAAVVQENDLAQQVQIPIHHHRHHHHVHGVQQRQQVSAQDDMSVKNMDPAALQCGSSNTGRALIEATTANGSLNGSACGSNHGSNFHNGSSAARNAEGVNMVNDNGVTTKDGADNGSGSGSGSGVDADQNRFAQREAALTKFRQKRKERCFEKRVRYQSRKKLAEQRPRVRGQFVRKV